MDSMEFNKYLFADSNLLELEYEQQLKIRRAYADIHPTRAEYDYELGKLYSVGIDVASYAIDIAEIKELQKRSRERFQQRLMVYKESLKVLTKEEVILINLYKSKVGVVDHAALRKAFYKLIGEVERITSTKKEEEDQRLQVELNLKASSVRQQLETYSTEIKLQKKQYLIKGSFVYMTDEEYHEHVKNEDRKQLECMEFLGRKVKVGSFAVYD